MLAQRFDELVARDRSQKHPQRRRAKISRRFSQHRQKRFLSQVARLGFLTAQEPQIPPHIVLMPADKVRTERARRRVLFVDLPGYGWAKVAKSERAQWQKLVEGYLDGRAPLRLAILLHDLRRDPTEDEHLLLAWLAERGVATLVAVTKSDKEKPMRRAARLRALAGDYAGHEIVATSAQTKDGIDALWQAIDARLSAE